MSDTTEDRIQMLEAKIEGLMGHGKAIEYALRLSLLSPGRPEALASAWNGMLPQLLDAHRDRSAVFQATFGDALQMLGEHIRLAAEGSSEPGNSH